MQYYEVNIIKYYTNLILSYMCIYIFIFAIRIINYAFKDKH